MMLQNHTSRYDVAAAAIRAVAGSKVNPQVDVDAHAMISYVKHLAEKDKDYIYRFGAGECPFVSGNDVEGLMKGVCFVDPEGTFDIPRFDE